jgi:hypothetical protein
MGLDKVEYSALPADLQAKLAQWEKNSPANKQVGALEDLSATLEQLIITLEKGQDSGEGSLKELGAVLLDIRASMATLSKKEAPDAPDYAGPVVGAVSQLEGALTAALKALDVKPEFKPNIHVDAPQVNVSPSDVDLSGVERVLRTELPKAFATAISALPETPDTDLSPLLEALARISEQLGQIDTATRMKPQAPNTLKVTNPDGTYVKTGLFTLPYDELYITYTDSTKSTISTLVTKKLGLAQQTLTVIEPSATEEDYVIS